MIKVNRTIFDETAIVFAYWDKEELIMGIGTHRLRFDGSEAARVWRLVGGYLEDSDAPKEGLEKWKD